MGRIEMNKCYMCNVDGTTREHVPPDSFFPKGYREGLITVPACPSHNNQNSKDVEYVRNVIVSHIDTNDIARGHFQGKVKRSFERSPKLYMQTFQDAKPIIVEGQETGVYALDLVRFNSVMEAIAGAIYFKSFGKTYAGRWEIFASSLISTQAIFQGQHDGWDEIRHLFRHLSLAEMPTPQPEIFRCGIRQGDEEKLIYRFVFYGGFIVYALTRPTSHSAV
jgi:hypothetical protein